MDTGFKQEVFSTLKRLNGINPLKQLFWSDLNYNNVNKTLSRRYWNDSVASNFQAEDPLLLTNCWRFIVQLTDFSL